jgi:hypothetical protein
VTTPGKGHRLRQRLKNLLKRLRRKPPGDPYGEKFAPVRRAPRGRSGAAVAEPEDDSYRSFPPRSR